MRKSVSRTRKELESPGKFKKFKDDIFRMEKTIFYVNNNNINDNNSSTKESEISLTTIMAAKV